VRDAYVYYRVDPLNAAAAAACADRLLQALAAHCAQSPRRLQRCDDASTWMEIYPGIADWSAFAQALPAAFGASGLPAHIVGERHLECFVTPAPGG
jgi:hypothetical protein